MNKTIGTPQWTATTHANATHWPCAAGGRRKLVYLVWYVPQCVGTYLPTYCRYLVTFSTKWSHFKVQNVWSHFQRCFQNWSHFLLVVTLSMRKTVPSYAHLHHIERGSWSALLACCCLSSFSVAADQSLHHQMAKERW